MTVPGPGKARCDAQRTDQPEGVTCKHPAGYRTNHLGVGRCYRHGGNTTSHKEHARELQAREACIQLGIPIQVDPGQGLYDAIATAYGAEAFYAAMVAQLNHHPKDGDAIYTSRNEPHVLVKLWHEATDRKANICAVALKAGVAQRMLDLAEDVAQRLAQAMIIFATGCGLDPDDPEVRASMREALGTATINPLNT